MGADMDQRRRTYALARIVFAALFFATVFVLLLVLVLDSRNTSSGGMGPNTSEGAGAQIVVVISLLTSLTSLIGFVSTTVLNWREEQRDLLAAQLARQRQELEIERLRLELEQLKTGQAEPPGES
jgi:cell division protein FtsL